MPELAVEPGGRAETRSNIFVAATIVSARASGPVRIRNMSSLGALVEGSVMPPEGERVQISRGSLQVSGIVVWQSGSRAGIRFDRTVSIADWLPRGSRTQQHRIDEAVHAYKSGSAECTTPVSASAVVDLRTALRNLEETLRSVAEDLARDAWVRERHLTNVQLIDVAAQRLAQLTSAAG